MERKWYKKLIELYRQYPGNEQGENDEKIDEILLDKNYRVFMREWGGKLVSSLTGIILHNLTGLGRDYMIIDNVITDEKFQGMGFASGLMREAEDWARQRDCYKIMIISNKKFKEAQEFYKKHNYECESSNVYIKHL